MPGVYLVGAFLDLGFNSIHFIDIDVRQLAYRLLCGLQFPCPFRQLHAVRSRCSSRRWAPGFLGAMAPRNPLFCISSRNLV